jgi:hypothetical protein
MLGYTIIKTQDRDILSKALKDKDQDIRGLDALAGKYKQERDIARAELAPLKAAHERKLANLKQNAGKRKAKGGAV